MMADVPKQYLRLAGKPVLCHVLSVFDALPSCARIVIATDDHDRLNNLLVEYPIRTEHQIVSGGETRQRSVFNMLEVCPAGDEIILIHDAARPCIDGADILRVVAAIVEHGAAMIASPVSDTVKIVRDRIVRSTLDRSEIWLAQTPQGARIDVLRRSVLEAMHKGVTYTDDASLLEAIDVQVHIVPGSPRNLKITRSEDLLLADAMLSARRSERMAFAGTQDAAKGVLYVVGTSLGNFEDISPRAIQTLRTADIIACEERRSAGRLLKQIGLKKELIQINEHTESAEAAHLISLLLASHSVALISDCGMPVIADPGSQVVRKAWEAGVRVEVVPGPTSIMAAVAVAGIDISTFHFRGFLSQKREERRRQLTKLRQSREPVVLMDTPYRLKALLRDAMSVFGKNRLCCIACDITLPTQLIMRGALEEIANFFPEDAKRQFVLIIEAGENAGVISRRSGSSRRK